MRLAYHERSCARIPVPYCSLDPRVFHLLASSLLPPKTLVDTIINFLRDNQQRFSNLNETLPADLLEKLESVTSPLSIDDGDLLDELLNRR